MKFPALLFAVLVFAAPAAARTLRPCPVTSHYKIIRLPLHPARINDLGVVAGTTEDHQPATWTQKDGLQQLKLPAGFEGAQVFGINQSSAIVGVLTRAATDPNPDKTQAFAYSQGKFTILSEAQSKAKAINSSGEAAGENNPEGPVAWTSGALRRLGSCCGGRALALNNHGQIVGEANDKEGRFSAFLWDKTHGLQLIPPPGSTSSTALAINDAGTVLVQSLAPSAVFLREQGKMIPVELSEESASQPLALNDCDVIVGEYGANSEYYRAFIWDRKNGLRDLNKLADVGKDWVLEAAVDINDHGEIVGSGDYKNEESNFLLIPEVSPRIRK